MLNVEVMKKTQAMAQFSGPDKGLIMTSLIPSVLEMQVKSDGAYTRLIEFVEDFHWKNAELKMQPEKVCFFTIGQQNNLGIAVSGTREVGPEGINQARRISSAIREVFNREYQGLSDIPKMVVDDLLKDYKKHGCAYSPFFRTAYFDDGTQRDILRNKESAETNPLADDLDGVFNDSFNSQIPSEQTTGKPEFDFHIFMKNAFQRVDVDDDKKFSMTSPEFYTLIRGNERFKALNDFLDSHDISKDDDEFLEYFYHVQKDWTDGYKQALTVDSLISRATTISEQSKQLADDLNRLRDGFDKE